MIECMVCVSLVFQNCLGGKKPTLYKRVKGRGFVYAPSATYGLFYFKNKFK